MPDDELKLHGDKQKPSTKRKYLEDIDDRGVSWVVECCPQYHCQKKGSCSKSDSPVFHISIP